ncbi:hypothetical protein B9N43_14370 [Denitratisoma sp. DHT3]|uniref:DUF2934 domain-containing protein n=1 Tax=Denitratisoma sp. DHT3 TaxID=1981880 RepID=UPI001198B8BF|nr:DUF2934 domain-containing protein [Denitratisoma sp. DHT3]QDX83004.1 hypothetical protein B9N43_14370 [Denitratisoma sp. DHT3]
MARLKSKPAAAPTGNGNNAAQPITPEQRHRYIEVAAYYVAERRGFCAGDAMADWIAAEQEIDRCFSSMKASGDEGEFVAQQETLPRLSEGKAS